MLIIKIINKTIQNKCSDLGCQETRNQETCCQEVHDVHHTRLIQYLTKFKEMECYIYIYCVYIVK